MAVVAFTPKMLVQVSTPAVNVVPASNGSDIHLPKHTFSVADTLVFAIPIVVPLPFVALDLPSCLVTAEANSVAGRCHIICSDEISVKLSRKLP